MTLEEAGLAAGRLHTLQRLYGAFEKRDGEAMQALYAPQATFDDPLFSLHGAAEIGAMWRMLCRSARKRSGDMWSLQAGDFHVEGLGGSAHWEVTYLYGTADRPVRNVVDSTFEFSPDGHILRHVDRFDFSAWAAQALGWPGRLFGALPPMRNYVRKQAAERLARFRATHL
ncbi:MAG: nuclear transport factor 2 family protein [Rubrivivax sp.]|nr:nuclear transport factor 2 family protein [Rubrivivax sp.]